MKRSLHGSFGRLIAPGQTIRAAALALCASFSVVAVVPAQQPPASVNAAVRQLGTIRSIEGSSLGLTTDKGEQVTIAIAPEAKVLQLPPGSTDLKAAQPAAMSDLAVGDRVLATGVAAEAPVVLTARRLIVMKSVAIAQKHESEQAGWQHGSGGVVSAVDAASGAITAAAGARTLHITTASTTVFRRYSPTSARFEDAQPSTLADLHVGDQLRVRGERSAEGDIVAEEIVSGSFRHLSGTIDAVNAASNSISVKDAKTKRSMLLEITAGTAIHHLPAETAARFAARAKSAGTGSGTRASTAAASAPPASGPGEGPAGAPRAGGSDLAQVVSQLPAELVGNLHAGEAVMVVGTDGKNGSISALTVLSGVEPILAASPNGNAEVALSPWSMGGGEAAGGPQ